MRKENAETSRNGLSSCGIDAAKGVLICLVVLGHLTVFSEHFMTAFNVLYNFHVAGFLFLTMLLVSPSKSRLFVWDRTIRYLVPYVIFVSFAGVLYYVIYIKQVPGQNFTHWLGELVISVIIGSDELLARACGIHAYWFLPALLSTVLIQYSYSTSSRTVRVIIVSLSLIVHLFVGLLPQEVKAFIPFGLHTAFFIFPLGLIITFIWGKLWQKQKMALSISATLIWICCMYAGIKWGSYSAIVAGLNVYSIVAPWRLLFHDVYAVSAFLSILSFSAILGKTGLLPFIGKHSLTIYLTHTIVWQVFLRAHLLDFLKAGATFQTNVFQIAVSFFLVLTTCIIISTGIIRMPRFSRVIFPRRLEDWLILKSNSA